MDIDISVLRLMEREKDVPFDVLVNAIEEALLTAYDKTEGAVHGARVELHRRTGHVTVIVPELDDEGNKIGEYDATPEGFGRVAASTARQVIMQRLRDAEDEQKYGHFSGVEGDIVSGVVQQGSDTRTVLVDLGKIEAIMPLAEQVPGERYTHGTRIKVYVVSVRKELRGPRSSCRGPIRGWWRSCSSSRCRRSPTGWWRSRRWPARPTPIQDRSGQPPCRRQRQGCLHRADGAAGPGSDARAERGEDRHHRLVA